MSSVTVQCPRCKTSLEAEKNGSEAIKCRCPKCDALFQVTLGAPAKAPNTAVAASSPTKVSVPTREKPKPKASAPKAAPEIIALPAERGSSSWLLVGGAALVLVGILSVGCIGLGVWGFVAWGEKTPEPTVVAELPKKASLIEERFDEKKDPTEEVPVKPEQKGDKKTDSVKPKDENKKDDKQPKGKERVRRRPDSEQQLTGEALAERERIIPLNAIAPRERLKEIKVIQIKGKSTNYAGAGNVTDDVLTWESLKRLKYDSRPSNWVMMLVRDHGWHTVSGANVLTLQGDGLGFYQNYFYGTVLSNLIPLMEEGFDIEKTGESKIRGKTCYGVLVKRGNRSPMNLYFDKETNLLFKAEFRGRFLGTDQKFQTNITHVEFFFSDYRVTDGINHWRKQEQWRDGKKHWEWILSEVTFSAKAEDSLFRAPGLDDRVRVILADYEIKDKKAQIQRALKKLAADGGSEFARLVSGADKNPELSSLFLNAVVAYGDLWRKNQAAPFERSDVPSLVTLLKLDDDEELQTLAFEGLAKLGSQADQVVPALVVIAREHRDPKMIGAALVALKNIGVKNEQTLTAFEKLLDHPDAGIADIAALALMELGPERLPANRVLDLLARPNVAVSAAAGRLLRQKLAMATRKDLPELRKGLESPNREVRLIFIDAIGSLKEEGRDAAPDLILLLGNPDKAISTQAVRALDNMGKLVEIARENSDAAILTSALGALRGKGIRTEDVLTIYEKHLQHPDEDLKNVAALAMLELAPDRLQIDRLTELMARPNNQVRAASEKLLRQKLLAVTVKDVPALRQGLKSPVREVCLAFVDAVASLKGEGQEAAVDLAGLLGSADKSIAIRASRALEGMGKAGQKAVPALEKALGGADKSVAVAATLALCKIEPSNVALRTKGIPLLLGDLNSDLKDLKTLLAQPLNSKSVVTILELGEPAVDPLVEHLLTRNNMKKVAQNQQVEALASRYLGYEVLKEFAKQAKASQDKKMIVALKKHEVSLRAFWEKQENILANQAKNAFGLPPDVMQLYTTAPRSASQALVAISALRVP